MHPWEVCLGIARKKEGQRLWMEQGILVKTAGYSQGIHRLWTSRCGLDGDGIRIELSRCEGPVARIL